MVIFHVLCAALVLATRVDAQFLRDSIAEFSSGCTVALSALPYPQPLILVPNTERFWHPRDANRRVSFPTGSSVELVCQSGFKLFPDETTVLLRCVFEDFFNYNSKMYHMDEFACNTYWLSASRITEETCVSDSSIVEVGFDYQDRFIKVLDACYDDQLYHTHYVRHRMTRANAGYQTSNPRPYWYQGDFYHGVDINDLYTVVRQRETIATILNSQERADELVQNTNNGIYMARGHIAARVDFIYGVEQNATFWFLNAAPQWQNFNGVNWERVEAHIRDFVALRDLDVMVYSGTYGVQSQADANGDLHEIFLDYHPADGTLRVPSPGLYYKILHDERHNAGIAIVGVNNIHITSEDVLERYVVCTDISHRVGWINWDRTNVSVGYCYACEVNEFNAAIGLPLPDLHVVNIL